MNKSSELENFIQLKDYLKTCNTSRSGQFGEKLFEYLIEEMDIKIDSVHKEGADFLVNGIGRVDVKAKVRLDDSLGLNRYQYPRHLPTSLGTAVQILPDKAHRCNYGA